MSKGDREVPRFLLTLLSALWCLAFAYAFVAYAQASHEGAGFPDGLNKPAVFLGWQGIAALLAFAVFGVSRAWPKGSGVRRAGAVPLCLALFLALVVFAVLAWHGLLF